MGPAGGPGHGPRFGGHLTRARLPRRAGRRQAGNGCVAARHLLRSVSAARSGSRRGRAPGWPLRPLLQSLAGGRRSAQWDGLAPGGLVWSLRASRDRVAAVLCAPAARVWNRVPPCAERLSRVSGTWESRSDAWCTRNNNMMSSSCTLLNSC